MPRTRSQSRRARDEEQQRAEQEAQQQSQQDAEREQQEHQEEQEQNVQAGMQLRQQQQKVAHDQLYFAIQKILQEKVDARNTQAEHRKTVFIQEKKDGVTKESYNTWSVEDENFRNETPFDGLFSFHAFKGTKRGGEKHLNVQETAFGLTIEGDAKTTSKFVNRLIEELGPNHGFEALLSAADENDMKDYLISLMADGFKLDGNLPVKLTFGSHQEKPFADMPTAFRNEVLARGRAAYEQKHNAAARPPNPASNPAAGN